MRRNTQHITCVLCLGGNHAIRCSHVSMTWSHAQVTMSSVPLLHDLGQTAHSGNLVSFSLTGIRYPYKTFIRINEEKNLLKCQCNACLVK